jgi:glycosyltransferase involved in cell wall biosynthesis
VNLGSSWPAPRAAAAAATIGRRPHREPDEGALEIWSTILPENSLVTVCHAFRPDVVVASSVSRPGWRRMRDLLARDGIPSALYIREEAGIGHLAISHSPPDLLLANAHTYAAAAEDLGYRATMIPSVVNLDPCRVVSSRERVLFINPVASYGVDRAVAIAAARPDVQFAFVEWWELGDDARAALDAQLADLPNVELRPSVSDPAALYADASVLITPYTLDMRPRVVLEAQVNGIPVLATDLPALRETVGDGGILVPPDAPIDAWVAALGSLVDDPDRYAALEAAARVHAARDEVDPEAVVTRFETALTDLVSHSAPRP